MADSSPPLQPLFHSVSLKRLEAFSGDGVAMSLQDHVLLHEALTITTRDCCALFPWQTQRGLPAKGPTLGIDHLSGHSRFAFDPWTLYQEQIIRAPSMLIMGQIGNGKSTLVKVYCRRQILADRQTFILDPKGEYGYYATIMRTPIISLRPGGTTFVNPLDPGTVGIQGESDRLELQQRRLGLMRALLASATGRPPTQAESNALDEAIQEQEALHGGNLMLHHVVNAMMQPTPEMARRLATSQEKLGNEIRDGAYGLRRLIAGDLQGMFDQPTNVNLDLHGNGAIIDLSSVYGQPALGPVMAAASTWLMQAIASSKKKKILVLDEAWAVLANPSVVAWLQATNKLARSLGVSLVIVMHRISDLWSQSSDAATTKQATGFLSDTETQVIFRQPEAEAPNLASVLALSGTEIRYVLNMPPFHALWRIGKERAYVEHIITEDEMVMANTDAAMMEGRTR